MDSRAPFKASYRHLVRGVYAFTRAQPGTVRLNLMRPYRLQFAQIAKTLSQNQAKNLEQFITNTLATLAANRSLVSSLSSLSYHNLPPPVHLLRASRPGSPPRSAPGPPPILWNAQDPSATMRAYQGRVKKDKREAPVTRLKDGVDAGLAELVRMAEASDGIVLGRWK